MVPLRRPLPLLVVALLGATLVSCRREGGKEFPSSAAGDGRAGPPPPHLVLVTIDTLRADHVGFDGYFRPTTPFLDTLAARGTVFGTCLSAASLTGPSHASMLTGVFPPQHGIVTNAQTLDPPQETLARSLAAAGWQTVAFTSVRFLQQLQLDFEEFHPAPQRQDDALPFRPAEETVDAVLEWWRTERDPARPTFSWIHFFDVHEAKGIPIDPVFEGSFEDPAVVQKMKEHLGSDLPYGERHYGVIDGYDTRIREVDRALRRLHEGIEGAAAAPGVWIFTSDHGEGLGSHGFFGHGKYLYEEQLRVPLLIVAGDSRFPPGRTDDLVRTIDLAPTIAELAAASFDRRPLGDAALDARSLVPYLLGERDEVDRIAFALRRPANDARREIGWEAGVLTSARTRRFKLIDHSDGEDEFFDLRSDPGERTNLLSTGGADPDAVERLRRALSTVLGAAGAEAATSETFLEELEQLGYLK